MRKIGYYILRTVELIFNKINVSMYTFITKYKINAMDSNLSLDYPVSLIYRENIKVGMDCHINRNVYIHAAEGVELGNNVTLSSYAKLISYQYSTDDWVNNCIIKKHVGGKIYIGDNAWICAGATILPGVRINGVGVIVAANSVLNCDINEDYVLVAGSPAKIVKYYNVL